MIEVELPDGSVAEFPEGTDPGVIKSALQKRFPKQAAPAAQPANNESPLNPYLRSIDSGINDSMVKAVSGIKQLIGQGGENDKLVAEQIKRERADDPHPNFRTGGDIGMSVATTALPGTALSKSLAARGISNPIANSALTSAIQSLILNPAEQGDSYLETMANKGKDALKAAAAGGLTTGLLQGATKAVTGLFRPTAEAEQLMRQGVNPTLQQGAESKIGKFIGALTSGVTKIKDRQGKEVMEAAARRVMPGQAVDDLTSAELADEAIQRIQRDYGAAYAGKTFTLSNANRAALNNVVSNARIRNDSRQMAFESLESVFPQTRNTLRMGADKMTEYRQVIQDQIDALPGSTVQERQAKQALIAVKDKFDELVRNPKFNPDEMANLRNIDSRNFEAKRLVEAADSVGGQRNMRVEDLMGAYKKLAPGTQFATEQAPAQAQLLGPALRTIGSEPTQHAARATMVAGAKLAGGAAALKLAAPVAAPLYGISLAGQTAPGARFLFGQQSWQPSFAEMVRQVQPNFANLGAVETQK